MGKQLTLHGTLAHNLNQEPILMKAEVHTSKDVFSYEFYSETLHTGFCTININSLYCYYYFCCYYIIIL